MDYYGLFETPVAVGNIDATLARQFEADAQKSNAPHQGVLDIGTASSKEISRVLALMANKFGRERLGLVDRENPGDLLR